MLARLIQNVKFNGDALFSVLDWKHLFGKNCPRKSKSSVSLIWNFVEYAEFAGDVHFFYFRPETPFLGKFGPTIQNCLKWNLIPKLTWLYEFNGDVHFFCFGLEILFGTNLV